MQKRLFISAVFAGVTGISGCATATGGNTAGDPECVGEECAKSDSAKANAFSLDSDSDPAEKATAEKTAPTGSLSGSCEMFYGDPKSAQSQPCPTMEVTVFSSDGKSIRTARIGGSHFSISGIKLGEIYRLLVKPTNNAWVKTFEKLQPGQPAELRIVLPPKKQ